MSKNIHIKPITKKTLSDALEKNSYWKGGLAPMSKSKAAWIISKPGTKDDDYCGVLGYEDDTIISFVHMVPEVLNNSKGNPKKVYFMESWCVAKEYDGSVLSTYIFNEAINFADKQFIIESYNENADFFYKKQPFNCITQRLRHTLFFSIDTSMLLGRFSFLKKIKFIVRIADRISYKFLAFINSQKVKKRVSKLKYDYLTQLDDLTWDFINKQCKNDLIYKDRKYIDWHITQKQFLQAPSNSLPYNSILVGISNNIFIHNLTIKKEGEIIGFLSFIINHNEFNVRYFLVKDDINYNHCVDALMDNFIKVKKTFIFTDDTKLSETLNNRYTCLFTYKKNKKGIAHKAVDFDFESKILTSQDGHYY